MSGNLALVPSFNAKPTLRLITPRFIPLLEQNTIMSLFYEGPTLRPSLFSLFLLQFSPSSLVRNIPHKTRISSSGELLLLLRKTKKTTKDKTTSQRRAQFKVVGVLP